MLKIEDNEENAAICLKSCESCMSYPGVEGEALFCVRSKSSVKVKKAGCNCTQCDIQIKYECTGTYYCAESACS